MIVAHKGNTDSSMIACEDALQILADHRKPNQVVISNQTTARLWPNYSNHPLDFHYLSSTMGGALPLGLGIALARPDHDVIVLSGDGSLLMNLGSLVTSIASGARNLTLLIFNNGTYEVTGGQRTPGSMTKLSFAGLATACGFASVAECRDVATWRGYAAKLDQLMGPRCVTLHVATARRETPRNTDVKVEAEAQRLRAHLARTRLAN